ncbi:MAG: glycoside hydrolase family 9 protein [Ruminococcus sp.]|nr:glycoside hydrolase family 9 protein [Ruminococcus sp.]
MKRKISKAVTGSLVAAAMLSSSVTAVMPMTASAEPSEPKATLIDTNFDTDPVLLPWRVVESQPAKQTFEVRDGALRVQIINPEGTNNRSDLQLRLRGLYLMQGHEYTLSFSVTPDADGYLYSRIGNYSGSIDHWNALGGAEYTPLQLEAGKTVEFSDTFIARGNFSGPSEWAFHYADNLGAYGQPDRGMPAGSILTFDNFKLTDNTSADVPVGQPDFGIVRPKSNVRTDQAGYFTKLRKRASYCTDNPDPCEFEIRDMNGKAVYSGKASSVVTDETAGNTETRSAAYGTIQKDSGKYVQILDFSDFDIPGEYTIFVKDTVGVSDTAYFGHEGFYDTKPDGDKLMWSDGFKSCCMNESHKITIRDKAYTDRLVTDALNYFYQSRSGIKIEAEHITSGDKESLSHDAPDSNDKAYVQSKWVKFYMPEADKFDGDTEYQIDVSGGWTDAADNCKSVINGAFSVWNMQNAYELAKRNGTSSKFDDGKLLSVPENDNGYPDILDEARYELEWMMKMIVDEKDPYWGKNCAGMVYHKVQDHKYVGIGIKPWDYIGDYDGVVRIVKPPTYAATADFAACAAQAARLWKGIDNEFADKCLAAAEKAYSVLKDRKSQIDVNYGDYREDPQFAPVDQAIGAEPYGDEFAMDEFYWAGCELFASTGNKDYYSDISSYSPRYNDYTYKSLNEKAFTFSRRFSLYHTDIVADTFASDIYTSGLGNISLLLNQEKLNDEDKDVLISSLKRAAGSYLDSMDGYKNGMGIPMEQIQYSDNWGFGDPLYIEGYEYQSNGYVANNALLIAYAYEFTGDQQYLDSAAEAMDYLMGRNGLGISYVTGYGEYTAKNPYHKWWANGIDASFPKAPDGVLVGGPAAGLADNIAGSLGMKKGLLAAQKCYVDNTEAFFENTPALQLNASLASVASILQDTADGKDIKTPVVTSAIRPVQTTSTSTTTVTTTSSAVSYTIPVNPFSTAAPGTVLYGDANCDSRVDISDAVYIMASISNPSKYVIKPNGAVNADCCNVGDGITNKDALAIQKFLLKLIDSLPE